MNVLDRLVHVSPSATRCLAILRALDQAIVPEDGTTISSRENGVVGPNTTMASRPTISSRASASQADPISNVTDDVVTPQVQEGTQDMFVDLGIPQLQDFGWFDSLPVDWSSLENLDAFDSWQSIPS